jgi:hypothetical protein
MDQAHTGHGRDEMTDLHADFQYADDIWQIALEFEFGVSASDKRYTMEGRGEPGSPLRKAWEAREAARSAWDADRRARQMNAELPEATRDVLKLKGMI